MSSLLPKARLKPSSECITASELVLSITLRCPLQCAHCCVSSDMSQKGTLSWEHVRQAITEAAHIDTITRVHYVGGDPFLKPQLMRDGMAHAQSLGLVSAATTSAFWARQVGRAVDVLTPLIEAGMREITISFDDYHLPFVSEDVVVNAVTAARQLGLPYRVAVVHEEGNKIDAVYVRRLLDMEDDDPTGKVYQTHINSTGRALVTADEETLARRRQADAVFRGACDSVLRAITITREANVLPCCGVMPHRESMVIGRVGEAPLDATIRKAFDDPLLRWISFEGPVKILTTITAEDEDGYQPEDFDGICTACDVLYADPELLQRARDYLPHKVADLDAMEQVLTAMGRFRRPPEPLAEAAVGSAEA